MCRKAHTERLKNIGVDVRLPYGRSTACQMENLHPSGRGVFNDEQLLILLKNGLQPLFEGTLADIAQELLNYRKAERASDLNCATEE